MRRQASAIAIFGMLILGAGASAAQAGDGFGTLSVAHDSCCNDVGSIDYLGRSGYARYTVAPGHSVGGPGLDIDSFYLPSNVCVSTWQGPLTSNPIRYNYDNRGKASRFVKFGDLGLLVKIYIKGRCF